MSANEVNIAALMPGLGEDLVLQERPIPSPGPGEVLIRNRSIAVNPIDWKQQTLGVMVESYPKILGSDIAGVVVEAGPAVDNFKPGDRVLAAAPSITTNNADKSAFQTFTVVPASYATKIPDSLTFNQAATLPMAVNTASIAFFANLNLPLPPTGPAAEQHRAPASPIPGDVLLVWSAGSSVGRAVVQIARILGSEVYATASPRHHEQIRKLGASLVLDYRSPTAVADIKAAASAQGKRILVAVDNNSNAESINRVLEVLSDGDEAVRKSLLTMLPVEWIEDVVVPKDVDACLVSSGSRTEEVRAWTHTSGLPRWLERGEIVPQPHRVVPGGLGGLQTALNELKSGVVSGEKLVVEV
ncbi:hypothetical protein MCOR07_007574 [Pyricularia oryzae]|nr:hypothetical protein MCOR26_003148 [Pyricularia oryzae]KAI6316811.1 hypothetical protein MCOR30_009199 [Pyricularia oryzae]KAI6337076.1 hypothetical protein MCOR28_008765 [Pyricularia oryzae]KAI6399232.1 hypothetical protein MCOR23_005354 [Pyricularia oryzae]KAI6441442.1 hypothetical protein MCOR22_006546 [Pyricularia oryzae]